MKLLFENWRKYLAEQSKIGGSIDQFSDDELEKLISFREQWKEKADFSFFYKNLSYLHIVNAFMPGNPSNPEDLEKFLEETHGKQNTTEISVYGLEKGNHCDPQRAGVNGIGVFMDPGNVAMAFQGDITSTFSSRAGQRPETLEKLKRFGLEHLPKLVWPDKASINRQMFGKKEFDNSSSTNEIIIGDWVPVGLYTRGLSPEKVQAVRKISEKYNLPLSSCEDLQQTAPDDDNLEGLLDDFFGL
jgi:hypothetical protein